MPLDVSDATAIPGAVDAAEAAFGTVTILVNNAGIPDAQRAHKMSLELIDAVLDTNVRARVRAVVRGGAPADRRREARPHRQHLVHRLVHYGGNGAALYSVSKAAVNRITEVLVGGVVPLPAST